jgi:hypothetical protein
MDCTIRIDFDDDTYRQRSVDDVIKVESPVDLNLRDYGGYALVDFDGRELWGFVDATEIEKIKHYKPGIVELSAGARVLSRANQRDSNFVGIS